MKPEWLEIAENEIGIHETPGADATSRIVEYFECTTLRATSDEVPWCSAFVNWVMNAASVNGTESAAARSWLDWGMPLKKPQIGCIVVLKRGNNPEQGHVGFYAGTLENWHMIRVLGGNQHDKVSYSIFPDSMVLGYRWPKEAQDVSG